MVGANNDGSTGTSTKSSSQRPVGKYNHNKKYSSKRNPNKPKMTKEERRQKYTQIARNRRDKQFERQKQSHLVCFKCRKKGHMASNCPEFGNNNANDHHGGGICYKCGSHDHGLSMCPKLPKGTTRQDWNSLDLPYASCFVCHQKGHLASQCTQNTHGIYVNGGECRLCGSNQHRATDCPENEDSKKKNKKDKRDVNDDVNVEDLLEPEQPQQQQTSSSSSLKKDKKKKKKEEQQRQEMSEQSPALSSSSSSPTTSAGKETVKSSDTKNATTQKKRRKVVKF